MVARQGFPEAMQKNMYEYFDEASEFEMKPAVYPSLFNVKTMVGGYETKTNYLGLGQLSERQEADDIDNIDPLEGWTITHKSRIFSKSFELSKTFVDDMPESHIQNVLQELAAGWAQGLVNTKEVFAAKFFNYGGYTAGNDVFNGTIPGVVTDSSGDLCYDGLPFFNLTSNTRTAKDGTTYYNSIASHNFSAANLQTSYNLMAVTNAYDEKGEKIALKPQIVLHGPSLKFTVKTVLENHDTANNSTVVQNLVQPVEWSYLTDPDAWFLGVPKKGLTWYERQAPVIEFYQNPKNKNYYVTIDTRFGAGVDNWRFWQGNNLSTS